MLRRYWRFGVDVFHDWNKHDAPRLGAALAFYSLLSLSPLIVLVVAIAGAFADRSRVMSELTSQFQYLLGSSGAQALNAMLTSAQTNSHQATSASVVSIITLLIGASGVFVELRSALDTIWDVAPAPTSGLWDLVQHRLFSVAVVLSIGFLLLASLVFSAAMSAVSSYFLAMMPLRKFLAEALDFAVSFIGVTLVFAMTFRFVPDARVSWKQAWRGGILTAILFTLGKYLIATYLTRAAVSSAYGAAGSIVVVIVWVYYTAQIFFFGAEFTHLMDKTPPNRA